MTSVRQDGKTSVEEVMALVDTYLFAAAETPIEEVADHRKALRAAIERLAQHPNTDHSGPSSGLGAETPKGWKLVPVEPTEEMWTAGRDPVMYRDVGYKVPASMEAPPWRINPTSGKVEKDKSKGTTAVHVWRAMLAATPPAPQVRQQGEDAKDAARYRWLRRPETDIEPLLDERFEGPILKFGDALDAAIDAALNRTEGEKEEGNGW